MQKEVAAEFQEIMAQMSQTISAYLFEMSI